MKKLLLLLLLAVSFTASSQRYSNAWSHNDLPLHTFLAVSFDARHLLVGSPQTNNNPSLNYKLTAGANYKGWEIGVSYERHDALKPLFQRYDVQVMYGEELIRNVSLYGGINYGSIVRESNSNFLSLGFSGEVRYRVNDALDVASVLDVMERRDVRFYCPKCDDPLFRPNVRIKLIWKFQK